MFATELKTRRDYGAEITLVVRFWRQALFWFCIALVLRVALALGVFAYSHMTGYGGFFPFESGADDMQFFHYAERYAAGREHELSWISTSYPWVLGQIFKVTGSYQLVGIMISALAGAGCVGLSVLICGLFDREHSLARSSLSHPAHVVGAIACFYPSAVVYSCMMTRDSLLLFAALASFYFATRFVIERRLRFVFLSIPFWIVFFDFRPYSLFAFLAACAVFYLWYSRLWVLLFRRPALAAAVCVMLVYSLYVAKNRYSPYLEPSNLEALRATYSGGSSVGLIFDYSSPIAFLMSYVLNIVYVVISPVPWQVTKPQHAIALAESLPLTLLLPVWLIGFWKTVWVRRHTAGLLLAVAAVQFLAFGLLSDNAGTNARLRMFPVMLFVIYCAVHYPPLLRLSAPQRQTLPVSPAP